MNFVSSSTDSKISVSYQNITTDKQLEDYCQQLAQCDSIAFDTEFVAEHTYRPQLCLIQVAAAGKLAVIDPLTISSMIPFWEVLASPGHETIVHAARSEVEFCLHAVGQPPAGLVDVQLAAGMAGIEFPAGYSTLLNKLLGEPPKKQETRTDWRRRPLSGRQIDYALDDVRFLHPLRDKLFAKLDQLGRTAWLQEEITSWQAMVQNAFTQERWRRVSGNSGLNGRSLAIVRELWRWREAEAERRDKPARRILRDDLIIELARRQTSDVRRISAVRGFERGDLQRHLPDLAACVQRGLELPEEECPSAAPRERRPQLSVLGQFLFAALGSICRQAQLAPNLVGTPNDIRDLILYRVDGEENDRRVPQLAQGWRAEFVGHLFDDLLAGKKAIRIDNPASDHPLVFESREDD